MKIYHNPRCQKSRATLGLLEEKGIEVEIIEYLKNIPTKKELKEILKKLGLKPIELIRKKESIFVENYAGKSLSDEEWIEAMTQYPKLIERPIVVHGNKAVIGRPPENILKLIS